MIGRLRKVADALAAKTDAELVEEVAALRAERRTFAQSNRGPFVEDANALLDERLAEARAKVAAVLAGGEPLPLFPVPGAPGRSLVEVAVLRIVGSDAEFEAAVRKAVFEASWPTVTKVDVEKRLAKFDTAIEDIEVEIQRREIEARRTSAEAELSALEA